MLTPQGQVKVLDLGLALLDPQQAVDDELTSNGLAMGTPDYIAPEQAGDAHTVDIRADIYSLGCTLYHLLTGRTPFNGPDYKTPFDKLIAHARDTAPTAKTLRPTVPDELSAIIERMMAKDPAARFATPAEVAVALTPFAARCDLPRLLAATAAPSRAPAESEESAMGTSPYASSAFTGTDPSQPVLRPTGKPHDRKVAISAYAGALQRSAPPRRRKRSSWIAAAAALPLLVLLGITIWIMTNTGTLELTIEGPNGVDLSDVVVKIDGDRVQVKTPYGEISVQVGDHTLEVSKAGFETERLSFTIRRNSREARKVTFPPNGLPQPGWTHHRADSEGSGFYPYGSRVRTPGAFTPVWSVATPIRDGFNCVLTGDLNGDGKLEVVVASRNVVKVYDGRGHLIRTVSPPLTSGYVDLGVLAPFDEGRAADIGVGTQCISELKGWFYKGDGTLLQTFAMQGGGVPHDCYMSPVAVTPATAIMSLGAGYARSPRGCAAYAKDTGNLAWYYRLGPAGEVGSVASIKDQLCMTESCGSVHNGASGDGWNHNGTPTTDRSIYTVVVNQHGSEVFTRDYGCGGNTYNHFVDLDGSGVKKVLTFESHDATYYHGWCKIHLLDGGTGAILKSFNGPMNRPWTGYVWGDFNHNNHGLIVATNGDTAYLLDENLKLLTSSSGVHGKALAAADINGDGKVELLFGDGAILRVTDAEFNELWTWTAPTDIIGVQISDLIGDGVDEVIVETHDGLTVLGAAQARPAAPRTGVSGTVDTSLNVALKANGGSASADSVGRYLDYVGAPGRAIDGDQDHGWCGRRVPGWLLVQFDSECIVTKLAIVLGAHKQTYSISLSRDGRHWSTVVPARESINFEGGPYEREEFDIPPTPARYMRVNITKTSAPRSHIFQAVVQEVEAYAAVDARLTPERSAGPGPRAALSQTPCSIYLALSPDAAELFVPTARADQPNTGVVYVVDTATMKVKGEIRCGGNPLGVAISPDGTVGCVTNTVDGFFTTLINPIDKTVMKTIQTGVDSAGVAFAPDGKSIWMTHHWSGHLAVVEVESGELFRIPGIDSAERTRLAALKSIARTEGAHDLAVTPDGEFAYVAGRTGDLYKVSIAKRSLVKTIEESFGGYGATCIRVSPDGKYAYVAGDKDRRLHAFATQGDSEAWALDLHAQGLCVSPDGRLVFAAVPDKNQVVAVSCNSHEVLNTYPVSAPIGLIVSPDGKRLYVSSREPASVFALDITETAPTAPGARQPGSAKAHAEAAPLVLLSDDFDRYPINTWPRAWLKDANASNRARNGIVADPTDPTNKVLRLSGMIGGSWAALAYRPCAFPSSFTVQARVYNGSERLSGAHPDRATIGLRQGTSWRRPGLGLIAFRGKGGIAAADDTVLQPYQPGRWYQVRIRYGRDGATRLSHYWIDGIDRGQVRQPIPNLTTERSLDHLDLAAQEGSAYFDDVQVVANGGDESQDSDSLQPRPPEKSAAAPSANLNVALKANGGKATADSVGRYLGPPCTPDRAINGDPDDGWAGVHIPGWLQVEFDKPYIIDKVAIVVGAHKQTYSISLSKDGMNWTIVVPSHESTNFEAGPCQRESFAIPPTEAKYIRVDVTETSAPPSHIFQVVIHELEAYRVSGN